MLELKNVTHQFHKEEPVLQQVSLQVDEGEFVAVIGRSGAGKTTLLKLFNGMVKPQQGTVWVDGECLSNCSGKKLRQIQQKIAVIYQDFCLVPQSTALENVLHGALCRNPFWRVMTGCFSEQDREDAKAALSKVGFAGSGGRGTGPFIAKIPAAGENADGSHEQSQYGSGCAVCGTDHRLKAGHCGKRRPCFRMG